MVVFVKDILGGKHNDATVTLRGWVSGARGSAKVWFIELNDGSSFDNLQLVFKDDLVSKVEHLTIGSAIEVTGKTVKSMGEKQAYELVVQALHIYRQVGSDYPLQKKFMTREALREIPHLRVRTNLFRAVMRIRSVLIQWLHSYYAERGFVCVSAPVITSNDGEGGGESFSIFDNHEFFDRKATLGVTGQLHAESYADAFGHVYSFAPIFRAEKSHTAKHAAEFWMLEPELAFTDRDGALQESITFISAAVQHILTTCESELKFLDAHVENGLINRLQAFLKRKTPIISYREAVNILRDAGQTIDGRLVQFGDDLPSEHEKFLVEKLGGPVAVTDYPEVIKAFYMKMNPDGETVASFDVLFPIVGELVGGSERECDPELLVKRINKLGISPTDLEWYINLRKFGQVQSSGFGIGFERLIMFITGVENIRDVIPFPRVPGTLRM